MGSGIGRVSHTEDADRRGAYNVGHASPQPSECSLAVTLREPPPTPAVLRAHLLTHEKPRTGDQMLCPTPHSVVYRIDDEWADELDLKAKEVPFHWHDVPESVLQEFSEFCTQEYELLRSIFAWLVKLSKEEIPRKKRVKKVNGQCTIIQYMLRGNEGILDLFDELNRLCGFTTHRISGTRKDRRGSSFLSAPHQWSAVLFDDRWYLCDVICAMSAEEMFYFLCPPEKLVFSHLPKQENWQLLTRVVTQEEWMELALLTSTFFMANLNLITPAGLYVEQSDGDGIIKINLKCDKSHKFQAKITQLTIRTRRATNFSRDFTRTPSAMSNNGRISHSANSGSSRTSTASAASTRSSSRLQIPQQASINSSEGFTHSVKRCVALSYSDGQLICQVDPPAGKYSLELSIFKDEIWCSVCAFKLDFAMDAQVILFPNPPNLFGIWGTASEIDPATFSTETQPITLLDSLYHELEFKHDGTKLYQHVLSDSNGNSNKLQNYSQYIDLPENKVVIYIRLPNAGKYSVTLHRLDEENDEKVFVGIYMLVMNKSIKCDKPKPFTYLAKPGKSRRIEGKMIVSKQDWIHQAPVDGVVNIELPLLEYGIEIFCKLIKERSNAAEEEVTADDYLLFSIQQSRLKVNSRLPKAGNYRLQVYEDYSRGNVHFLLCSYRICALLPCALPVPYVKPLLMSTSNISVISPVDGWLEQNKEIELCIAASPESQLRVLTSLEETCLTCQRGRWRGTINTGTKAITVIANIQQQKRVPVFRYQVLSRFELDVRLREMRKNHNAAIENLLHNSNMGNSTDLERIVKEAKYAADEAWKDWNKVVTNKVDWNKVELTTKNFESHDIADSAEVSRRLLAAWKEKEFAAVLRQREMMKQRENEERIRLMEANKRIKGVGAKMATMLEAAQGLLISEQDDNKTEPEEESSASKPHKPKPVTLIQSIKSTTKQKSTNSSVASKALDVYRMVEQQSMHSLEKEKQQCKQDKQTVIKLVESWRNAEKVNQDHGRYLRRRKLHTLIWLAAKPAQLKKLLLKIRLIRTNLQLATLKTDKALLLELIQDYHLLSKSGAEPNGGVCAKAELRLAVLSKLEMLKRGMEHKSISTLQTACIPPAGADNDECLALQRFMAERLLKRLQRQQTVVRCIEDMSDAEFLEMKSFSQPPTFIFSVLQGFLMLLNVNQAELETWSDIQDKMVEFGVSQLKAKMRKLRGEQLSETLLNHVSKIIECTTTETFLECSPAAACIHIWMKFITYELLVWKDFYTQQA